MSNETNTKKEEFKIQVIEPATFDTCYEKAITTSKNLSLAINSLFVNGYRDYYGCNLVPYQQPNAGFQLLPYLFFEVLPEDVYKETKTDGTPKNIFAFKPASKENDTALEKIMKMSAMSIGGIDRAVNITDEGKQGLDDFIIRAKNINWNEVYSVKAMDGKTFICVKGLDMIPLLKKIYGAFDEEGSVLEYKVEAIKPINTGDFNQIQSQSQNWVVNIDRCKSKALERACEASGVVMNASWQIPAVRAER